VFGDLAALEAEHVEPRGRVLLRRVLGVGAFAHETEHDEVALGDDRDQRRLDLRLDRLRSRQLREEVDERGASGRDVRLCWM
jgi:hypothetical protein